jgi:hypothetical protein
MEKLTKKKPLRAWVVISKGGSVRKFYGYGEWCFDTKEEAEHRVALLRSWKGNSTYEAKEVTIALLSNT